MYYFLPTEQAYKDFYELIIPYWPNQKPPRNIKEFKIALAMISIEFRMVVSFFNQMLVKAPNSEHKTEAFVFYKRWFGLHYRLKSSKFYRQKEGWYTSSIYMNLDFLKKYHSHDIISKHSFDCLQKYFELTYAHLGKKNKRKIAYCQRSVLSFLQHYYYRRDGIAIDANYLTINRKLDASQYNFENYLHDKILDPYERKILVKHTEVIFNEEALEKVVLYNNPNDNFFLYYYIAFIVLGITLVIFSFILIVSGLAATMPLSLLVSMSFCAGVMILILTATVVTYDLFHSKPEYMKGLETQTYYLEQNPILNDIAGDFDADVSKPVPNYYHHRNN